MIQSLGSVQVRSCRNHGHKSEAPESNGNGDGFVPSRLNILSGCWGSGEEPPPPPPAPTGDVEFSYNPQDPHSMQPGITVVSNTGAGPSVDKAKIKGRVDSIDGKYVFPTTDGRYYAANTLAGVARAINTFEAAYGAPISWAFSSPQLTIIPDGGEMLNAYYQRNSGSLNFFHYNDKTLGRTIYSGGSGEVVAHEAGHAILDGIRPGYLGSWTPDPGAFHESFGDVLAMLIALKDDSVLAKVVEQTGGDLSKQNVAAHLGEELGIGINHQAGSNATGGDWTRNAINPFTWKDPKTLPANAPHDQLSRGPHSFSRLWTGAIYDVLKGMTNDGLAGGQSPEQALSGAADEMLKLYGSMMKIAPNGSFTFKDMARALLKASEGVSDGRHTERIRTIFTERKILPPETQLDEWETPTGQTQVVETTLNGPEYGQFSGARVQTIVDATASFALDETEAQLKSDMLTLIQDGRIRSTLPGQKLEDKDYFDAKGEPYVGVAKYDLDGQLVIERVPVLT